MKAALVRGVGQSPVYANFAAPVAADDEVLIKVTASALSPIVKSRASGAHYSSSGRFPFVPGVDGVGRRDDGARVFFILPRAPFGALAERTVAPRTHVIALPDDLDDVTAAAIANPGMSSWTALSARTLLKPGETVLVNGATGIAGMLAVQIAKHLGAKRVIASGRNAAALREATALGADETIVLNGDAAALDAQLEHAFARGVDVVLDYLWGASAERILIAAAKAAPEARAIRFLQIGAASGGEITLPSAVLRASALTLMGSGIGSVPADRMLSVIAALLRAAGPCGFKIAAKLVPLTQIETAWAVATPGARVVFTVP